MGSLRFSGDLRDEMQGDFNYGIETKNVMILIVSLHDKLTHRALLNILPLGFREYWNL